MANPERKRRAKAREPYQNFDGESQLSESIKPLAKDWRGVGEWSEALLRIKEGWVVVTLQGSALQKTAEFTLQKNCLT